MTVDSRGRILARARALHLARRPFRHHGTSAMKLITHNMLSCPIKGVKNGFPFRIEVGEVATREADFDPTFLRHILPRIEYGALRAAAASLGRCGPGVGGVVLGAC